MTVVGLDFGRRHDVRRGIGLTCRGLRKSFGSSSNPTIAFHSLDLEIRRSELTFLTGPPGAGKSVLLRLVAGLLDADGGVLRALDHDITRLNSVERSRFRREHCAYLEDNLYGALSVLEQVELHIAHIGGAGCRTAAAIVALQDVGLTEHLHTRSSDLSKEARFRVAIARALAGRARLFLADDPTASLDSRCAASIVSLLRRIAHGYSVCVLCAMPEPAFALEGDRIVRIEDGRVVADARPK